MLNREPIDLTELQAGWLAIAIDGNPEVSVSLEIDPHPDAVLAVNVWGTAIISGPILSQQARGGNLFKRRANLNELPSPPGVAAAPDAVEILRVWAAPGQPVQLTLRTIWQDPAAWGLMIVDLARHAAQSYERDRRNGDEVLARIRAGFDAEWSTPTD